MLKTVVLLHIFVETVMHLIFQDSLIQRNLKRTAFIRNRMIFHITYVFTVTFDPFNKFPMNGCIKSTS